MTTFLLHWRTPTIKAWERPMAPDDGLSTSFTWRCNLLYFEACAITSLQRDMGRNVGIAGLHQGTLTDPLLAGDCRQDHFGSQSDVR